MNLLPSKCLRCGKIYGHKPTLRELAPGEVSHGYCEFCSPLQEAQWRKEIEYLERTPLIMGKTREEARTLLGVVLRHPDGPNEASHGCVEVKRVLAKVEYLLAERDMLRKENARLLDKLNNNSKENP